MLDVDGPLVQLPEESWDGGEDTGSRNQTVIGLRAIGDLAEDVVRRNVLTAWSAGELAPATTGDELLMKYTVGYMP